MTDDTFQRTAYCIKHDRDMYYNILTNDFVCDLCQKEI